MQEPQHTPIRRRSGYDVLPTSPAGSAVAVSPGAALLKSICSTLGGWVQDQPEETAAEFDHSSEHHAAERVQSIVEVLEGMGTWALQAAALNICLPSNGWIKPVAGSTGSSRCSSLSPVRQRHPMHPPSNGSSRNSCERDLAVRAAERDNRKTPGQDSCSKHPHTGSRISKQTTANMSADSTPPSRPAAATNDSSSQAAELAADNERMQREILCLRASLGTLFIACSTLKEENQRLRVVVDAGSDDFLSDALEQLLGEKNALQQEVARLKQQNKSLQELLEYTAPAAAPSVSEGPSWVPPAYEGGGSSSNLAGMVAATPAASVCGNTSTPWTGYSHQAPSEGLRHSSIPQAGTVVDVSQQPPPQQQECFGYYLATPTGSVAGSSSGGTSGRVSPVFSSAVLHSDHWQGAEAAADSYAHGLCPTGDQQYHSQQQTAVDARDGAHVGLDAAVVDLAVDDAHDDDAVGTLDNHQQQQQQQRAYDTGLETGLSPTAVLKPLQLGRHAGKQQQLRLDTSSSTVVCVSGVLSSPGSVAVEQLMALPCE